MKKIPYHLRKTLYPYRSRISGNFKGQNENNSQVRHRCLKQVYQTRANGVYPIKPIAGRRGRDTKYKDERKGKL